MGDRVPGLKTGELAGVIFKDDPGPCNLLLVVQGVLAITSTTDESPVLMLMATADRPAWNSHTKALVEPLISATQSIRQIPLHLGLMACFLNEYGRSDGFAGVLLEGG